MEYSTVPFEGRAVGMLTVAEARRRLAETEPIESVGFWTGTGGLAVRFDPQWYAGVETDAAPAWLTLPDGRVFQLTKQAAKQVGSEARIPKKLQEFMRTRTLAEHVNWAYNDIDEGLGEKELKLLTAGSGREPEAAEGQAEPYDCPLVVAQCRGTVEPFSNVELLDTVILTIRAKLGDSAADSAWVDYKFSHDLEHTVFRIVVPVAQQVIDGTGEEGDAWCYGVEVHNSLIGLKQLVISGYLFRLGTTAGITDVEHAYGGFSRRGSTPEAAFAWTAEAVEFCLSGAESAFKGVQVLTETEVSDDYPRLLDQLFRDYPVAKDLKLRVLSMLENKSGDLTMYDLAHEAAAAANVEDTNWRGQQSLLYLAGGIVHQGGGMCDGTLPRGCRRLLPEAWDLPPAAD
jgi:hypothetical protein